MSEEEQKENNLPPPIPPREEKPAAGDSKKSGSAAGVPPSMGSDKRSAIPPKKSTAFAAVFTVISLLVLTVLLWTSAGRQYKEIPYSPDFLEMVNGGFVTKVAVVHENSGVTYVRGERVEFPEDKMPRTTPKYPRRFRVNVQPTDRFQEMLESKAIPFEHDYQSPMSSVFLGSILPVLVLGGIIYFIFTRQMKAASGGAMSFGRSRAKLLNEDKRKTTFANVAGIEEAKEEVQEIIEYLKDATKFKKLGGHIPKGVLLVGPPGTGKTLLARAIAGEAKVPFFSISGSDFEEMFVGVGASRVRDMFEQGKKNAPCIIFIDEIDAVGFSRTNSPIRNEGSGQTLNALLSEMDGFDTDEGVIIIAATNRPEILDEALRRPGRFDRQIVIDLPTLEGRFDILKVHAEKVRLAPDADLRRVARSTPGFSGADLANLVNEAALLAARQNKDGVENSDLDEARDKVLWGRERKGRVMDPKDKRITAIHEAGHAVANVLSPEADPLHKVTIIPRGMSLGSTMFLPEKDATHTTRQKLLTQLTIAMGGRAAEELMLDDICTGARQDIAQATSLARAMVCDFGMSDRLGPRSFGKNSESMFLGRGTGREKDYSEETAKIIDEEVTRLVSEAHKRAFEILSTHRDGLEKLVDLLLEKETVDGRDAEDIVNCGHVRTVEERGAETVGETGK